MGLLSPGILISIFSNQAQDIHYKPSLCDPDSQSSFRNHLNKPHTNQESVDCPVTS
ncbi:hypothetical protein ACLOJK_010796 [Asimina triloba]